MFVCNRIVDLYFVLLNKNPGCCPVWVDHKGAVMCLFKPLYRLVPRTRHVQKTTAKFSTKKWYKPTDQKSVSFLYVPNPKQPNFCVLAGLYRNCLNSWIDRVLSYSEFPAFFHVYRMQPSKQFNSAIKRIRTWLEEWMLSLKESWKRINQVTINFSTMWKLSFALFPVFFFASLPEHALGSAITLVVLHQSVNFGHTLLRSIEMDSCGAL